MSKPDFSGTSKFNLSKSVLQIPAPDSTVVVYEIVLHSVCVLDDVQKQIDGEK